ncbi:MAG: type II secretion system F family protein [Planctomycetota bacterium]
MTVLGDPVLVPLCAAALALAGFWAVASRSRTRAPSPSEPPRTGALLRALRWALALFAAAVLWRLTDRPALAMALVAIWAASMWLLRSRTRHRLRTAEENHAIDAIGAASRALRAGIPIGGMLEFLAAESRGETRRAFREIVQREQVGEEMGSAIRRVLLVSPLTALRAFGLTLLSQLDSGGDIADTADRLARALIERRRMHRRARTIMAYTRTAATLLAVLPAIVVPALCMLLDEYAQFMLHSRTGNMMLAISACLLAIGTTLIQRLSRIDAVGPRSAT